MAVPAFSGLNTALRGLLAQQRSLDVTAHNIANAETEGYSRQEAVLATAPSLHLQAGAVLGGAGAHLGQGVEVEQYRRIRDDFLDLQLRAQNMAKGAADMTASQLTQVETVLGESKDGGIGTLLDRFWSSWQTLADNPESSQAKTAVLGHAQTLATAFNALDSDLGAIAANATAQVGATLSPTGPVARSATELAQLNQAISQATKAGVQPNDLLDRRDLLLDQLSQYGQVSVTPDTTPGNEGMVTVAFGGATTPLVSAGVATVPTAADLSTPGGSLGALQAVAGTTIPGYRAALDALANGVATAVNAAHPTAVFSGATAASLAVVAAPGSITAGTGAAGDNSVARALAAQRGGTVDSGYADLVARIGGDLSAARTQQSTSAAVVASVTQQRQSVSGVSMDEEMTNMVRFQRGYQAAARALTTMDDALDTLINRTGRVGL